MHQYINFLILLTCQVKFSTSKMIEDLLILSQTNRGLSLDQEILDKASLEAYTDYDRFRSEYKIDWNGQVLGKPYYDGYNINEELKAQDSNINRPLCGLIFSKIKSLNFVKIAEVKPSFIEELSESIKPFIIIMDNYNSYLQIQEPTLLREEILRLTSIEYKLSKLATIKTNIKYYSPSLYLESSNNTIESCDPEERENASNINLVNHDADFSSVIRLLGIDNYELKPSSEPSPI